MDKKVESRRKFLKKVAYAVPTVVALGQISNPSKAAAGSFMGGGTETGPEAGSTAPGTDRGDAYNLFGSNNN